MADDEDLLSSESGEDTMLRAAIESLRAGDRVRARDLLTRLVKATRKCRILDLAQRSGG